jgi:hypothetical protein
LARQWVSFRVVDNTPNLLTETVMYSLLGGRKLQGTSTLMNSEDAEAGHCASGTTLKQGRFLDDRACHHRVKAFSE